MAPPTVVSAPEASTLQVPDLGFSILHQKVELDIDLPNRSIRGRTEITISPHTRELKFVRLNCRQCELTRLTVNGKPSSGANYEDPYSRTKLPWEAGIHQYHFLQHRLEAQLKDPPEKELVVTLPKSLRIDEIDPFTEDAQGLALPKPIGNSRIGSDPASAVDLVPNPRNVTDQLARFTPITIIIEYTIRHVRDGMHFVGWEAGDLRYPHAYTMKSLSPGAACCLFPCMDDLNARCTWEIAIRCQKTLGDTIQDQKDPIPYNQVNGANCVPNGVNGVHGTTSKNIKAGNFTDEDISLELNIVCSGDMTDEIVDAHDPTRKTTSFMCTTAISVKHVGFAIGPFEHVDLAEFRESDEDERLGQNAVPIHGFCLPGRIDEMKNTCLPLAKAADFFTMTYGAYPFSSYSLCFVDDLYPDILDNASLSVCSNRLLFPEDIIEPLYCVSRQLVHALATQWIGVNIVPKEPCDLWVVVGIAYFITDLFMKKLSGNNEYRYNQKRAADRVCELDVDRPSLADTGTLVKLDPSELEFLVLKAPLVLFILDRRLIKAGGSSGLSRVISKVFLNAKVGDLLEGAIDSASFMKTCEKIGHMKLDVFYAQWVAGAGCPRFQVSQRFNKKKLVVEMMIQQLQNENVKKQDLKSSTFMRDVKEDQSGVYAGPVQAAFTVSAVAKTYCRVADETNKGPMTIRIHEADGTPYEHIIEIKDAKTSFDIPYNTKYKRLKRSRRQKERTAAVAGTDYNGEGNDDVLLYSLGDVLMSEEEMRDWRLEEWSKDEEERMSQESYEWIRMDADFEWICKMAISLPPYMFVSQLQQDKDVIAQLESIQYIASVNAHPLVSTILIRTLMDHRYFHGIRTSAAAALAKNGTEQSDWIGLFHLEKAFKEFFCYADSSMTRSNDFSDRALYYLQCAIPNAISRVRDASGKTTFRVRNWLFERLKFNDNSNNEFSDCYYLATLMNALAEAAAAKPPVVAPNDLDDFNDFEDDGGDSDQFNSACLDEIDRYRRLDQWIPSYHNILSTTAMDCKRVLSQSGIVETNPAEFLQYTAGENSDHVRLNAFSNIMAMGTSKQDAILRWFFFNLGTDPSPYVRESLLDYFGRTLGSLAIGEHLEVEKAQAAQQDGLVIEQDATTEARQADLVRKQTVQGALAALKDELSTNSVFKQGIWSAMSSPNLSLQKLGHLLNICALLYTTEDSIVVKLTYPRYWTCKRVGKGKIVFSRSSRVRTTPIPRRKTPPLAAPAPLFIKRENSSSGSAMPPPLPKLKLQFGQSKTKKPSPQPTPPILIPDSGPVSHSNSADGDVSKPKLKLSFGKLKGSAGAGSPQ